MARYPTDEGLAELLRMAKGGRRTGLTWYNLEDQLTAIDALGETGSEQALDYLRLLSIRKDRVAYDQGIHREMEQWCPNASGELKEKLTSRGWTSSYTPGTNNICGYTPYPEEEDLYYGRTQDLGPAQQEPRIKAEIPGHSKQAGPEPSGPRPELGPYERILRSISKLDKDPRIRLRTCPDDKRRELALELAAKPTDQAISEMKRMVEGGLRTYTRSIWTLWLLPVPVYYTEEDRKTGLEALSATGRPDALEYLTYT